MFSPRPNHRQGFSLMELLIALCIIVIATTILVPLIQNMQVQSEQAAGANMATDLNNTYASWKESGGQITSLNAGETTPFASSLLWLLGQSSTNGFRSLNDGYFTYTDGGTSNLVGVSLPTDIAAAVANAATSPSASVTGTNYVIGFDGNNFTVVPVSIVKGIDWQALTPTATPVTINTGTGGNATFDANRDLIFVQPTPVKGTPFILTPGMTFYNNQRSFLYFVQGDTVDMLTVFFKYGDEQDMPAISYYTTTLP